MEKSLKNLISALGEKPTRWLPNPPPTPLHRESAEFTLWKERDSRTRTRIWDTEKGGGEGRKNTAKLNNSSTEQHFDAIFHMKIVIPFLLLIALTKCAYLLLASLASKNGVLYSEGRAYKREPELAASPQSTALLYIQQATPLWRTVNQEQSRPQQHTWNCQPLLFFPLNYYCT